MCQIIVLKDVNLEPNIPNNSALTITDVVCCPPTVNVWHPAPTAPTRMMWAPPVWRVRLRVTRVRGRVWSRTVCHVTKSSTSCKNLAAVSPSVPAATTLTLRACVYLVTTDVACVSISLTSASPVTMVTSSKMSAALYTATTDRTAMNSAGEHITWNSLVETSQCQATWLAKN